MKKALIVDMGAGWGGQEIYSKNLAAVLLNNNWEVNHLSAHQQHGEDPKINWIHNSVAYKDFGSSIKKINLLQDTSEIIHFNGTRAIYLSALVKKKRDFIATKHSHFQLDKNGKLRGKIARLASCGLLHNIDDLICVSKGIASEIIGPARRRTRIIHNGVADLGVKRENSRPGNFSVRFCYIGRLYESKGLMRLLGAAHILDMRGIDFHITIAGQGPLQAEIEAYIYKNNLTHKVSLPGFLKNPEKIYHSSDVCILPSIYEGLPLSLLEAMSTACTLIGHPIPGVLEIIRDGENGLIADATEESLANAMFRLISDPSLREKLCAQARKDYEDYWNSDRMWTSTLQVYERFQSVRNGN